MYRIFDVNDLKTTHNVQAAVLGFGLRPTMLGSNMLVNDLKKILLSRSLKQLPEWILIPKYLSIIGAQSQTALTRLAGAFCQLLGRLNKLEGS